MTAFVDTNVLIRHLTGDPPVQAVLATRFLRDSDELLLPDLILAEVAYVLESYYETPRPQVADTLRAVLAFPGGQVDSTRSSFSALSRSTTSIASTSPRLTWSPAQSGAVSASSRHSIARSTGSRPSDASSRAESS